MPQNENVLVIPKPLKRLLAMFIDGFPDGMPENVVKLWTNDATVFNAAVARTLIPPEKVVASAGSDFAEKLKAQENFWRRLFPTMDFGFEPENMLVWPRPSGHDRLLVTPRGLWGNRLYEKCAEKFPCWRYTDDLDKMVHFSGSPYVATARWFRDRQEADEELAGKSALDLEQMLIPGIIVPERELYELVFFEETGDHLDKKNETLNSGSRPPDGRVPRAGFRGGRFSVGWCRADGRDPGLRSRSAG